MREARRGGRHDARRPRQFRPRKRFAQHFLEASWAAKVAGVVAPRTGETFLEIGPGRGALTYPLSAAARRVVALEIDRDLVAELAAGVPDNVTIVEGDVLAASVEGLRRLLSEDAAWAGVVRVAGNLPYNLSSPILFKLVEMFEAGLVLTDATVMLQREVADRLLASPGTRDYGVLTVLMRRHADVERLLELPPGAFRPPPAVRSTVVRLWFRRPEPGAKDETVLAALVRAVFTRRRKTLANALLAFPAAAQIGSSTVLARASLDGRRRPETLDMAEIVRLADSVYAVL